MDLVSNAGAKLPASTTINRVLTSDDTERVDSLHFMSSCFNLEFIIWPFCLIINPGSTGKNGSSLGNWMQCWPYLRDLSVQESAVILMVNQKSCDADAEKRTEKVWLDNDGKFCFKTSGSQQIWAGLAGAQLRMSERQVLSCALSFGGGQVFLIPE